jgi:hypothetical protein
MVSLEALTEVQISVLITQHFGLQPSSFLATFPPIILLFHPFQLLVARAHLRLVYLPIRFSFGFSLNSSFAEVSFKFISAFASALASVCFQLIYKKNNKIIIII